MLSVVKPRVCPLCGEKFYLSDGRYKYCSDECAEKAQLKRRGGTVFKRVAKRHETRRELERQQFLDDYWRRYAEFCKNQRRRAV